MVRRKAFKISPKSTDKLASVPQPRAFAMGTDELPILKGILNGVVNYHNARRCPQLLPTCLFFFFFFRVIVVTARPLSIHALL